ELHRLVQTENKLKHCSDLHKQESESLEHERKCLQTELDNTKKLLRKRVQILSRIQLNQNDDQSLKCLKSK
ncbi:hypothetical protein GJ496_004464, partial [Pomphorhynchus laevis]